MSLLASLLYDRPLPIPPGTRKVIALEMIVVGPKREYHKRVKYGSVQPRVLEYLGAGGVMNPLEVSKGLDIDYDSVVRALKMLCKKGKVLQVRAIDPVHHVPSLWKIIGKEDQ